MKKEVYNYYRLKVLSKASGSNVHHLNHLLGIILNGISNYNYYINSNKLKAKEIEKTVIKAITNIYEMTGVTFSRDNW